MLKSNKTATHIAIGQDVKLYIIKTIEEHPDGEKQSQFKCRYFSNGTFHTDVFFGFELKLTE